MAKQRPELAGTCPVCGCQDLKYQPQHWHDSRGYLTFPWECTACHAKGDELYEIRFVMHDHVLKKEEK